MAAPSYDRRWALIVGVADAVLLAVMLLTNQWIGFIVVAIVGGLATSAVWTNGRISDEDPADGYDQGMAHPDDRADTAESVEEPPVKPADDGGAPAPSDGSTSAGAPAEPGADIDPPAAEPSRARRSGPPGPPSDPATGATG